MKFRSAVAVLMLSGFLIPAPLFAQAGPAKTISSRTPNGEGDPAAIVCRAPQKLENSRLLGPEVCKPNAEWAQYVKDGMDVSPDGRHDVPLKKSGSCQSVGTGGGTATGGGSMSSSVKCD